MGTPEPDKPAITVYSGQVLIGIGAGLSLLLLRFLAREVNSRAAFFTVAILNVTPLMALGSLLMTIDPLSVLFWTAAMMAGWRAAAAKRAARIEPAARRVLLAQAGCFSIAMNCLMAGESTLLFL